VVAVDAEDRPVRLIGSASIGLFRERFAQVTVNPERLIPDGVSLAEVTGTLTDNDGNPVPAGTRFGVTAEPVFLLGSAGGTVGGPGCAPSSIDPRFLLCETKRGGRLREGRFTLTYTAPSLALAPTESRTAIIQVAGVNEVQEITGLLGTGNITLRNDGFQAPQPVVVSVSPADGETGVGLNTTVVAEFSQPLDPATVTSANFFVRQISPTCCPTISGTLTVSDGPRGANTVVTFTPSGLLAANAQHEIQIRTGIRSATGNPLLRDVFSRFTTGRTADVTTPEVVAVSPPDGATGVPLNSVVRVEFSEPVRPASIHTATFLVEDGGVPISGRVTLGSGVRGPHTLAIFTPDALLAPNTTFRARVTTGVMDGEGNPLAGEFQSSFTTGVVADNVRPLVVSVNPAAGETEVPVNTEITVVFSEPMDPITLNATTFPVRFLVCPPSSGCFFQDVVGAYSLSPDGLTATLMPAEPLVPNSSHQVRVTTGARDLAGNPLLPPSGSEFSSAFTTEASLDTEPPRVTRVSPAPGFSGLAVNGRVCVKFSEDVDPTTITAQGVVLTAGGVPVEADLSFSLMNRVVCVRPANLFPFAATTTFVLTVTQEVTDVAGNPLAASFESVFTAGSTTDTTAPTVTAVNPPNGATNVAVDTAVVVSFDEPIDPTTVHLGSLFVRDNPTGRVVAGSFSFSADRTQVSFMPVAPLLASRSYSVRLSGGGVTDLAGNAVAFQTFSFTTGAAVGTDLSALPTSAAVAVNPPTLFANGQTTAQVVISNVTRSGVVAPNGTRIGVTVQPTTFADSVGGELLGGAPSPADPRFQIVTTLGGGATLTYRSPNLSDLPPGQSRTATVQVVAVDAEDRPVRLIGSTTVTLFRSRSATLTLNPSQLKPDNTCSADVTVVIRDNDGNVVPAGTRFGGTADSVFLLGSAGGTLSGPGCALSSADPRFLLCETGQGGTFTLGYTPPTLLLEAGETRTAVIEVAAVNNDEEATGFLASANFTLTNIGLCSPQPVVIPPGVAGVSPGPGETDVGLNAVIVAEFSQPLAPTTVTSFTFRVRFFQSRVGFFQDVPGTLSVLDGPRGADTVVIFTPANLLPPVSNHDITITTGIRSADGNPLATTFSSSFTTGASQDGEAPTVVQVSPLDGKTDVQLNAIVQIEFSEPMQPRSITPETFTVEGGGIPISGRLTVGNGAHGPNTVVTFRPDQPLAPNAAFTIRLTTAVTETEGSPLAGEFTSTFATTATGDSIRPSVLRVDPANGASNVPATTAITVRFSEPVNPITVNNSSFFIRDNVTSINLPGVITLSEADAVATISLRDPLFPGRSYTVRATQDVRDVADNRLLNTFVSSFSVPLAAGTGSLPTSSSVLVNPPTLFANGQIATTVNVSNINRSGTLVPNGTLVAVTADPAFTTNSVGGFISGSSVGPSPDSRFLLFEILGAAINIFYTPPDLAGIPAGQTRQAVIQVASVDASGRPVNLIGQGTVTLFGIDSATVVANPTSLPADGTSTSTLTVTVRDRDGDLVPDGTPVGLTAAPIYNVSTAGGTIIDGRTSSADPRVQVFTTVGGQFTATYRSPSSRGSGTAVIQVLTVANLDRPTGLVTRANVSLQ
jgi:hypothetical protein